MFHIFSSCAAVMHRNLVCSDILHQGKVARYFFDPGLIEINKNLFQLTNILFKGVRDLDFRGEAFITGV
jgi:hypothetical protein